MHCLQSIIKAMLSFWFDQSSPRRILLFGVNSRLHWQRAWWNQTPKWNIKITKCGFMSTTAESIWISIFSLLWSSSVKMQTSFSLLHTLHDAFKINLLAFARNDTRNSTWKHTPRATKCLYKHMNVCMEKSRWHIMFTKWVILLQMFAVGVLYGHLLLFLLNPWITLC